MKIPEVLKEKNILLDLQGSNTEDVLKEFTDHLAGENEIRDAGAVYIKLLEREKLETTGIERDLAIPHVRTSEVGGLTTAVGVSRKGVDFNAMDGGKTHLFFLILAPRESSSQHLKLLAAVSRLTRKREVVEALISAGGTSEILEIIEKEEPDRE